MAGTWKSAPANYFCTNISFYFRFQPLNFEGGTSPNLQFALNGCKETWKIRRSPGSKPMIFVSRWHVLVTWLFLVQNHENNNKQKMFLRDFPLSIPEWDLPKKNDSFLHQQKSPKKPRKSQFCMAKLHTRKLAAGYPKLWVGQGDSFEIWHFIWYVKSLGVEFLSNLGHWSRCIWSKKLDPQKKDTTPRMVFKKPLKVDSVTEKSILFLVKKGFKRWIFGTVSPEKNKKTPKGFTVY